MSRVVLLGIAGDLADQLTLVLREEAHQVSRMQSYEDARWEINPEVAFICGDGADFIDNLCILLEREPQLPVVVVTRLPETGRWLDALEAGARDYCGAPFERVQVRWIMETVCPRAHRLAA